ncbi:MAG: hypothetical protein ACR2L4_04695 [Actinomycetota bacterium]
MGPRLPGERRRRTFLLVMESPNVGVAPNGDHIQVTGEGEFSVHSKS